ncbi:hypothetical protein QYE76_023278 [Lolium multiflorum]|uniref:Nucleoplasmin-like domain-containing protein n=1 Tax=Lolium multiflorum TaxID=4521 RepID=A0AAD8RBE2_LOLMU|nr:hypothetical protein QYE76_023278 [Lolium multiflorum]
MEFWGIEVKPGQSVKVSPEDDHFLHISQGAFGEVKKDDKVTIFVKVDDQKLSIGTLSTDKFPQVPFDLVFEKEFELSHTSKSSSVFFSGYMVFQPAKETRWILTLKKNLKMNRWRRKLFQPPRKMLKQRTRSQNKSRLSLRNQSLEIVRRMKTVMMMRVMMTKT